MKERDPIPLPTHGTCIHINTYIDNLSPALLTVFFAFLSHRWMTGKRILVPVSGKEEDVQ